MQSRLVSSSWTTTSSLSAKHVLKLQFYSSFKTAPTLGYNNCMAKLELHRNIRSEGKKLWGHVGNPLGRQRER
jgi:hypothetical protein